MSKQKITLQCNAKDPIDLRRKLDWLVGSMYVQNFVPEPGTVFETDDFIVTFSDGKEE